MRLRDDGLVLREIDGETILLDLVGSAYFASNRTGTFLLQLMTTDRDRESLASALAQEFDLSMEEATADTDAFLAMLESHDMLV